jgi:hypothetical protein
MSANFLSNSNEWDIVRVGRARSILSKPVFSSIPALDIRGDRGFFWENLWRAVTCHRFELGSGREDGGSSECGLVVNREKNESFDKSKHSKGITPPLKVAGGGEMWWRAELREKPKASTGRSTPKKLHRR